MMGKYLVVKCKKVTFVIEGTEIYIVNKYQTIHLYAENKTKRRYIDELISLLGAGRDLTIDDVCSYTRQRVAFVNSYKKFDI